MFVSVRSESAELLVNAEQQGGAKSARVLRASVCVSVVSIALSIRVVVVCVGVFSFVNVVAISSLTVCSPNFFSRS